MAKITIEIEDKALASGVSVKVTPSFEQIVKGHIASGNDFSAAEGFAIAAINRIREVAKEPKSKLIVNLPKIGR